MKNLSAFLSSAVVVCALLVPAGTPGAATECRETIVNGRVVDRTCVKVPKYRTVCEDVWRNGVRYRNCKKVRVR